jgi:PKD repeat protein
VHLFSIPLELPFDPKSHKYEYRRESEMSSKVQSLFVSAMMLISTLFVGLTALESYEESSVPGGEKEEEPLSRPSRLSSSYSASILLGSDNPEHDGEPLGSIYKSKSSSYIGCYSSYYSYVYESSSSDRYGWAVFDLKDLTQWSGVNVTNAKLVYRHYSTYNIEVIGITALKTTPYYSPSTPEKNAVFAESGPSGTQIGTHTFLKYSDYVKKTLEIPLNSQAVTELNNKLNGSKVHYTFGVGMYIDSLWPKRTSGYAYFYDVRLEVSFEYDSELESTAKDWRVAFGDDLSGYGYKYSSTKYGYVNYYNYPYGYLRAYKYASSSGYSYDYRGYAQWEVPRIRNLLLPGNTSSINITKVSLRFNHNSGNLKNIGIYHMQYDVTTATAKQIQIDCGDGIKYYGPHSSNTYSRDEFEWDLGPDAVSDFQDALEDYNRSFFGIGIAFSAKASSVLDFGPKLVLEWGDPNQPPVADAGLNQTVNEGEAILLDGSASNSPGGSIEKYEWDFDSDGTYDYQEAASSAPDGSFDGKTTYTYADNGVYTVTLKVTDENSMNATDTCTITVYNVAPTVYAGSDQTVNEGDVVSLDPATFNDKGTLDTHTATINWGDGTSTEAGTVSESPFGPPGSTAGMDGTVSGSHVYADNGGYTVSVSVTDDDGAITTDTVTITVNNVAPTVYAGSDQTVNEGDLVNLDPATFNDKGTLDTHTATINWGDGTSTEVGTVSETPFGPPGSTAGMDGTVSGSHVYADNDDYTVSVSVTDDDGAITTDTVTIIVNNVAPTMDAGADQTIDEGDLVNLDPSSFNDKGTLDTHTATINWGDGTSTEAGTVTESPFGPPGSTAGMDGTISGSHVYADNNDYTVTVTNTDDDGAVTADTITITVQNVAPTVWAGANQTVNEGDLVSLDPATFNDKGTLDTHTATINWGDGTSTEAGTVTESPFGPPGSIAGMDGTVLGSHIYGDNGVFMVTVTVTDDDGGVGSDTFTVTVNNVAPTIQPFGPFSKDEGSQLDLAATSTDPGSDDLTFTWELEMGLTLTNIYYNDGTGPDPYPSPWGTFPFSATDMVSHMYGDDGVYYVTLTVEDDDGGVASFKTTITVNNVAPSIDKIEAYIHVDFTIRAAGEKWHNVEMYIKAGDDHLGYAEIVRYPGSPDDQSKTLVDVKCDVTKAVTVTVLYTPADDSVNGQPNGATPCWVNISFEDGDFRLLKHNFNVNQPKNWKWNIEINRLFVGKKITFESTAEDQGSDDLIFSWEWGDGSPLTDTLCCNDGINPEPTYDPSINDIRSPWGTCPFSALDVKTHTFNHIGIYSVTLTVSDDDGGAVNMVINIILE